jgi:hypothetical protein
VCLPVNQCLCCLLLCQYLYLYVGKGCACLWEGHQLPVVLLRQSS